jgi:hypothetical protein
VQKRCNKNLVTIPTKHLKRLAMASIFKRKIKDGKGFHWRAIIRIKGFPTVCETFERKQKEKD